MKLIEATNKNEIELVKKLIKEGCDINEKDTYGWTSLMYASCHGRVEILKELIKYGASINEKTIYGNIALIIASLWKHKEIIKELIKAGASLIEKDDGGKTALDYHKEIWQTFEIQDLILSMYPDKYSLLEETLGINKDILLKLKMQQIIGV